MGGRSRRRPTTAKRTTTCRVPIDRALAHAIEIQRVAFVAKFGREPGAGDPLFFDPDADTPQRYSEEKFAALAEQMILGREFGDDTPIHGVIGIGRTFCGLTVTDEWVVAYAEEVDEPLDCADCRAWLAEQITDA